MLTEQDREYIRTIRDRITPETWTQDTIARDKLGNEVSHDDPTAVCWCLDGHLYCVVPVDDRNRVGSWLNYATPQSKEIVFEDGLIVDVEADAMEPGDTFTEEFESYIDFNDHWTTGVEDVIQILDALLAA